MPGRDQALWKDAGAQHLALGALDESQTDELLEAIVGGPVEAGVRQWIWELSRGNALYVTELLRGLLAGGAFSLQDGLWWMSGRPQVPTSLAELMSARVSDLGDGARRSLELLALGEPLRLSELTRLEPLESLVSAEAEGLITVDENTTDPLLRLAHPLYSEALQASLPDLRARALRLGLAESLQQNATLTPEASLRVARWLLEAGESVPQRLLGDAAGAAIATGDPELAGLLAARAVAGGGGMEARLLLARSLAARNRFEEAAATLADAEQMIGAPEEAIEPDMVIAYLQQQTEVLFWGLNRVADVRALLERAGTWWPDTSWQRRLDPLRDLIDAHLPRERPGVGGRRSSILSDATGSDHDRQRAVQTAQLRRLAYDGRSQDAYRLALALRPAVPFRDVYDEGSAALWVGVCLNTGEGWDELERWCAKTMQAAVRSRDHSAAGIAALGLSNLRYAQGRFRDASRWLAEASCTTSFMTRLVCSSSPMPISARSRPSPVSRPACASRSSGAGRRCEGNRPRPISCHTSGGPRRGRPSPKATQRTGGASCWTGRRWLPLRTTRRSSPTTRCELALRRRQSLPCWLNWTLAAMRR